MTADKPRVDIKVYRQSNFVILTDGKSQTIFKCLDEDMAEKALKMFVKAFKEERA